MATYNTSSSNVNPLWQQQYPYNNSTALLNNAPYDNYLGNHINTNNAQSFAQNNQFLKCRPVSSREEAMACQIDLDGSLWVFTDLGNGNVYTKKINNDGTALFQTYALVKEDSHNTDFITREQLNKTMQALIAAVAPGNSQEPVPAPANNKLIDFS